MGPRISNNKLPALPSFRKHNRTILSSSALHIFCTECTIASSFAERGILFSFLPFVLSSLQCFSNNIVLTCQAPEELRVRAQKLSVKTEETGGSLLHFYRG